MRASVARENGFESAQRLSVGRGLVREELFHCAFHFCSASDKEKVALAKELLVIVPGGGDERNSAGQRLKHTNGWDAVHGRCVLLARNMYREPRAGVGGGRFEIGQISAVVHSGIAQSGEALFGVAYPENLKAAAAERHGRSEQEFANFFGTFLVAPIADPYDVGCFRRAGVRAEDGGVGGLVQSPNIANAELLLINAAQRIAECEDAV